MSKKTGDEFERITHSSSDDLEMTTEGVTKSLREWTRDFTDYFYPEIGSRTLSVPAFYFNHQHLQTPEQAAKKNLISLPYNSSQNPTLSPAPSPSFSVSSSTSSSLSATSSSSSLYDLASGEESSAQEGSSGGDIFIDTVTPIARKAVTENHSREQYPNGISLAYESIRVCEQTPSDKCSQTNGRQISFPFQTPTKKHTPSPKSTSKTISPMQISNEPSTSSNDAKPAGKATQSLKNRNSETSFSVSIPRCSSESTERLECSPINHSDNKQKDRKQQNHDAIDTKMVNIINQQAQRPQRRQHHHHHKRHPEPVQLMCPPQESMSRRDKSMGLVLEAFKTLGKELELEETKSGGGDEAGKGLFIISGVNYDHYLDRIPSNVRGQCEGGHLGDSRTARGVLDIMVLQQHVGMVLVQVKSVGGNKAEWQASESDMVSALKGVIKKVRDKSSKLRNDFSRELLLGPASQTISMDQTDEALPSQPFHVLALPFIPRRLYLKTQQDDARDHDYFDLKVLCKEDFEDSANSEDTLKIQLHPIPSHQPSNHLSCTTAPCPALASPLYTWWKNTFVHAEPRMSKDKLKEIAGRICGMFSTLTVQPDTKCHSEVRTLGHAISETAARYSAPRLTIPQFSFLQGNHPFVALSGPPGSGKSLMLTLKAVQWLEGEQRQENPENIDHVVVVHLCKATASTQPSARILMESIKQRRTAETARKAEAARSFKTKNTTETTKTGYVTEARCETETRREADIVSNNNDIIQNHLLKLVFALDDTAVEKVEQEVAMRVSDLVRNVREARVSNVSVIRADAPTKSVGPDISVDESHNFLEHGGHVVAMSVSSSFNGMETDGSGLAADETFSDNPVPPNKIRVIPDDISDSEQESDPGDFNEKFHFVISEVDPKDEKTMRLLRALREHPQAGNVWWSTTEPPGTEGAWPLFQTEELSHVTRRPLHVQRVLKKLERRERWESAYALSSVESSLPTEGPPLLCLHRAHQHVVDIPGCDSSTAGRPQKEEDKDSETEREERDSEAEEDEDESDSESEYEDASQHHNDLHVTRTHTNLRTVFPEGSADNTPKDVDESKPAPMVTLEDDILNSCLLQGTHCSGNRPHSSFWCDFCAETVAETIAQLTTDSLNPKIAPFHCGSTKFLKNPSKNRFGVAIKPRDILIVTTSPHLDTAGFCQKESTTHYLKDLAQSTLVRRVRETVPLKVLREESSGKIAFPKNCAVLTDASNVQGLERKVVIYVPCDGEKELACHGLTASTNRLKNESAMFTESAHFNIVNGLKTSEERAMDDDTASMKHFNQSAEELLLNGEARKETDCYNMALAYSKECNERSRDEDACHSRSETESQSSEESWEDALQSLDDVSSCEMQPNEAVVPSFSSGTADNVSCYEIPSKKAEVRDSAVSASGFNVDGVSFDTTALHNQDASTKDVDTELASSSNATQLPSWLTHKQERRSTVLKHRSQERLRDPQSNAHAPKSTVFSPTTLGVLREPLSGLSQDLDKPLSGLSDVDGLGLYSAASCCLAQLVVLV